MRQIRVLDSTRNELRALSIASFYHMNEFLRRSIFDMIFFVLCTYELLINFRKNKA